ncbi:MAG: NADH-quinone oxidoreductase subunit L [Pseudomonadota bacterium]
MEPLVVLLPLFGALISMPLSRIAGPKSSEVITSTLVGLAAAYSWVLFFDVALGGAARTVVIFKWISSGAFQVDWAVRLDTLSAIMLVVINSVSFLVHVYSMGYMKEYGETPRFFAYLSLFTFAMLMLVTADNFVQLFFGWEGVGLASYLLIGFWYKKPSANAAAMKAFVVNRVGDFGFALGIFCIFYVFNTVQFDEVLTVVRQNAAVTPFLSDQSAPIRELTIAVFGGEFHALTTIAVLLFIGAMGKSAQFLLHTWLPDAMEGPTPVSALIHAATMVTAGVFLVCRTAEIFEAAPAAAALVTVVGATTAFFAATVGLLQDDIKKIVAYSTCSQLGYMFFAAGVGSYDAAMFHLFTHAFFKALLFLGSGAVIIGMHHEQDTKKMGGVRTLLPVTHLYMFIGTIAITGVGIPGMTLFGAPLGTAGFVSKDMVIENAFLAGAEGRAFGMYAFVMGLAAAVMTAFYSWRLMYLTFYGPMRAPEEVIKHPHDVPNTMLGPLLPLAVGALAAGIVFYPYFIGDKGHFWNGTLPGKEAIAAVSHADNGADVITVHSDDAAHHTEPQPIAGEEKDASATGHSVAKDNTGSGSHRDDHSADHNASHGGEHAGGHAEGEHAEGGHGEGGHGGHHVPTWVLWAPFISMAFGTVAAVVHYSGKDPLKPGILREGGMIYSFLKNKWYFDEIYNVIFVQPSLLLGRFLWKRGDGSVIDGLGPDGVAASVAAGAKRLVKLQSGYMYHYAFVMLIGLGILITYMLLRAGG